MSGSVLIILICFNFIVNIYVFMTIFIKFYYKFIVSLVFIVNIYQTCNLVCMFSLSNELFIFIRIGRCLVKMKPYCLNLNYVLNFCAAVGLQPIITLAANFFCIKFLLGCFLVYLLVNIYGFYSWKDILL